MLLSRLTVLQPKCKYRVLTYRALNRVLTI